MRDLTTADVAFLLCTSQHGARYRLTLETTYGLVIDLAIDGAITISLQPPPTTPTLTDTTGRIPRPLATPPSPAQSMSIDAILLSPISPAAVSPFSSQPPPPSPENTPPRKQPSPAPGPGYRYRIWPDFRSSTYLWYAPNWPGNPAGEKRVPEADMEARYPGEWFDAWIEWVERGERAALDAREAELRWEQERGRESGTGVARGARGAREGNGLGTKGAGVRRGEGEGGHFRNPFGDEGERTLWAVEGLLLACWLGLQEGIGGVEYQPEGEIYVLDGKGGGGGVLRRFLEAVRI
ncbi:hypothetical protein B0T25DRAFT_572025 [Lasiosphaeria hispida]|uniref:Uncharacterized protein n=1 Tax=Lasiosphaeria hispida TaxID=260671 RepID=A0AAJ0HC76_9PEZI|nr:hypothetical protein B0T25DRAFT_572025 [Lasiosphaeria hispida]